ncbi:hypothetical protein QE152_g35611 [Popillia japonica]|uniref:Uncharacterized protein n=1 Tax=Popillia japonica TaxID=7064 RepID=A0AAW1IFY2_POPJA
MEGFKTPKSLAIDENIVSNWKKFVQSYNIYLLASGSANKSAEVRAAIFLNFIGEDAIDLFNTFNLAEEDKKDVEKIKKVTTYIYWHREVQIRVPRLERPFS